MTSLPTWLLARHRRSLGGLLAFWLCAGLFAARGAESPPATALFRFGFSSNMLGNVNRDDARAAVRVWSQIVARERDIPADSEANILESVAAITEGMRAGKLDAIALSLSEYREVVREQAASEVFVAVQGGRTNVEYLVLVQRDSPFKILADLRDKTLNFYQNHMTSLALVWLDTALVKQGLKPTAGFFGQVKLIPKLSAVVLPVFFRQADACLVSGRGFETLCELNPQVGKQLRPLAISPPFVPGVFCVRASYHSPIKEKVLDALAQLHTTPAGLQVLTLFQFEGIRRADPACLQRGLDLLAAHERLCGGTNVETTVSRQTARLPDGAGGGGE